MDPINAYSPSPVNPLVITCQECGYTEHLDVEHCRCGAHLASQLRRHFIEWAEIEQRKLATKIKEARNRSLIIGAIGFSTSIGFVVFDWVVDFFLSYFGPHGYLIVLSMNALCWISFALWRRKKRLEQRSSSLCFDDFVRSPKFKALDKRVATKDIAQ